MKMGIDTVYFVNDNGNLKPIKLCQLLITFKTKNCNCPHCLEIQLENSFSHCVDTLTESDRFQ